MDKMQSEARHNLSSSRHILSWDEREWNLQEFNANGRW